MRFWDQKFLFLPYGKYDKVGKIICNILVCEMNWMNINYIFGNWEWYNDN